MKNNNLSENELDLDALFQSLLESDQFKYPPDRRTLLIFLWEHRNKPVFGAEIWKALGHDPNSYSRHLVQQTEDQLPVDERTTVPPKRFAGAGSYIDYKNPPQNVRERCSKLSAALKNQFEGRKRGWIIKLPEGGPQRGYQLECEKLHDEDAVTTAFWKPHLDASKDVVLLYAERLFYSQPDKGFVFRFYDCNAEDPAEALQQLGTRHGAEIDREASSKPQLVTGNERGREIFKPQYRYVASGEIEARDAIKQWFAEKTFCFADSKVTRDLPRDTNPWQKSLVLLGSAPSNRFINEALESYPDLPVQHPTRTQVQIADITPDEKARIESNTRKIPYSFTITDTTTGQLEFPHHKNFYPAIITRIPNPYAPRLALTILESELGHAVAKLANVLTNDETLKRGVQNHSIPLPLPKYFQFLCAVTSKHDFAYPLTSLIWREYLPRTL